MFGLEPSIAAKKTLVLFKEKNIKKIVELGAGLGRDTIFFANNSIHVEALDYSSSAIKIINEKAKKNNLLNLISAKNFDIREKLPFDDNSIEACFSHMLYCMALSTSDLKNLNNEICRIIKPGGINVYTVRHIEDGDYKNGIHRGENLYENDGFIVFQPSGYIFFASSFVTLGTIITSSPGFQSAGVAILCFAVLCIESIVLKISWKLRPVVIG